MGRFTVINYLFGTTKKGEDIYWSPDSKYFANPHLLINGQSGSGKTTTILDIAKELAYAGKHIFMFDLKGDMVVLDDNGNRIGNYITMTAWGSKVGLSPFEFDMGVSEIELRNILENGGLLNASEDDTTRLKNSGPKVQVERLVEIFKKNFHSNMGDKQQVGLTYLFEDTYLIKGFKYNDIGTWLNELPVLEDTLEIIDKLKTLADGNLFLVNKAMQKGNNAIQKNLAKITNLAKELNTRTDRRELEEKSTVNDEDEEPIEKYNGLYNGLLDETNRESSENYHSTRLDGEGNPIPLNNDEVNTKEDEDEEESNEIETPSDSSSISDEELELNIINLEKLHLADYIIALPKIPTDMLEDELDNAREQLLMTYAFIERNLKKIYLNTSIEEIMIDRWFMSKGVDIKKYFDADLMRSIKQLEIYIKSLVKSEMFHGQGLPIKAGLNVINISGLEVTTQRFIVDILLGKVFKACKIKGNYHDRDAKAKERGEKFDTCFIIDESKLISGNSKEKKDPYSYLNRIATEARGFGLALIVAAQSAEHYPPEFLKNFSMQIILDTSVADFPTVKSAFNLTKEELEYTQLKKGNALIKMGRKFEKVPVNVIIERVNRAS